MKKGKKKKTKKYVLTLIATVLFIAYSVWALLDGNDVGGVLGIGTALLLVVSFVYNWKVDREDEEKRQELEAKAPQIPQDLPDEVRAMKAKGQDIQAIKLVRELTGMSLYDAKNFVDNIDG
ncbi:MAG: ribosomal protein L7/L12 [Lachnospiraceae bacterium]|nr:ribosomal protein L7/L12 [Lachnospiraceae bacterium]